jgi:hypothetical protein
MRNTIYFYQLGLILFIALITGCSPSRTITASGKVTPQGKFKVGYNSAFNVATAPLAEIDDVTKAAVNAVKNRDSIYFEDISSLSQGLLAYSLDPVGTTSEFYLRYGLAPRVDVGYKFASGAHVFDAMYQFLGSTGTPTNPGPAGLYGSIGIQYSGQNSNLPSKLGLNVLSSVLDYELSRKDILIPLVFSHSLGPEEEIGNISWGLVYGHSFVKYGFSPTNLFRKYANDVVEKINPFMNKENYSSFGAFLNAKLGYRYAYFVPAVSIYYQNYGNYNFFGIESKNYKGVTIVPSLGLQFNLGYDKKR